MPDQPGGTLYDTSQAFDLRYQAGEATSLAAIVRAYTAGLKEINKQIDAMDLEIKSRERRGKDVTSAKWRAARLGKLKEQVEEAILDATAVTVDQTTKLQEAYQAAGVESVRTLIAEQNPDAARTQPESLTPEQAQDRAREFLGRQMGDGAFARVDLGAVRAAVGFYGDGTPLRPAFEARSKAFADGYIDLLSKQLVLGWNPRKAAALATQQMDVEAHYAELVMRTESLRSLRESQRQTMMAYGDVLDGWVWNAHLADARRRTCAACIALHGRFFPTGTVLGTHPMCRCAQIPAVKGSKLWQTQPGPEWFAGQSEDFQRDVLGPSKFDAYRSGEIILPDLVGYHESPKWGPGRYEASLNAAKRAAKARVK